MEVVTEIVVEVVIEILMPLGAHQVLDDHHDHGHRLPTHVMGYML
jgi:hypothetical protein